LVKIFKLFGGANDISTLKSNANSLNKSADTSFTHLHLFRNGTVPEQGNINKLSMRKFTDSRNRETYKGHARRLYMSKSLVGVSIARPFVDWLLDDLDVSGFITQLERVYYGIDENFLSTLNANDLLDAPGGFTRACLYRGVPVGSVSR